MTPTVAQVAERAQRLKELAEHHKRRQQYHRRAAIEAMERRRELLEALGVTVTFHGVGE